MTTKSVTKTAKTRAAKKTTAKKTTAKRTAPTRRADTRTAARRANAKAPGKRTASKPQLLSGGNPQIPKGDGDAPVQDYLAAMPGWKGDVGRHLDALIVRTVPRLQKAVRWNSPFYGVADQGWFLSFHCFDKYVKVTFLRGTALHPLPPTGSKVANVRYLDVRENDELDEKLLISWLEQASVLPGDPLF
jgi:hypothetical protein